MRSNYDVVMLVMNGILSDSRVLRTARTAYASGLSVVLLGLGKAREDRQLERLRIDGPDVYLVPGPSLPYAEPGTPAQGSRHRLLLRAYEEYVLETCANLSPRIIHSHDMTTIAAGGLLKQRYSDRGHSVSWIHDLHEWVGGLTTIAQPIHAVCVEDERNWIGSADVLTTVSPDIARIIRSEHALPQEPTVILNTPLLSDFDPTYAPTVRDVVGVSEETPLVVYCGQVKEARGVHDLVRALPLVPDLHVALVTNNRSSYVDDLVRMAESQVTRDRLHLVAYVDQQDVASFIRTASIGVHTLARYGNGDVALPNKLFEYTHASLPVVVSDCRAMAAFVEKHQIGTSYTHGDVMGLARAMERTLVERDRLRSNVERVRATHSWERQEDRLRRIYADLLGIGAIRTGPPFLSLTQDTNQAPTPQPLRIIHGPAGSANQPWTLARALRRRGHTAVNVVGTPPRYGFRSNLLIPWARMDIAHRFQTVRALADEFDIFHFHARSFFAERVTLGFPSLVDLLLLRLLGKVVVFHFRGTEARLSSEFERLSPFNYVAEDPYGFSETFPEPMQRRMIGFVTAVANATYAPDHELAGYVPGSEVIPRAIDLAEWQAEGLSTTERPLIVHAPTRSEIKGTRHVVEAVEQLRHEGLQFDFELVEGLSHDEAKACYRRADIIVDQLRIGWYGVLAVEGMALGKAVVSYVRPDLVEHLETPLPFALADPSTVTDVLRRLITRADERTMLGHIGRAFVERVHSADVVATTLEARYRSLLDDAPNRRPDYDGIAALFELQAAQAGEATGAMTRVRKVLRAVEGRLADATPQAKRSMRALAEYEPRIADRDALPALRAVIGAHRQVSASLGFLDGVLLTPSGPETRATSGPASNADPSAPGPRPAATAAPQARHPNAPTAPPPVRDVADANRWGLRPILDRLALDQQVSWEEVGAATVGEPAVGLALLDELLRHRSDTDRDAVARHLAIGAARTFERQDNRLLARVGGDEAAEPSSIDVKHQVRFARQFYNLRSVLGNDAAQISGALLRTVLHDLDPARPTPFSEHDDTRINDLSWFFINTARPSADLADGDREQYELSLNWFATRTHLWSVEAWETTRVSLAATLRIRWTVRSGQEQDLGRIAVRTSESREPLELTRRVDRATGRLEAMETTLRTSIDQSPPIQLQVSAPQPIQVVVALPRYGFDPLRSTPALRGWEPGRELTVSGDGTAAMVQVPSQLLRETPTVTAFAIVEGRYLSRTLDRQIEQMRTLDELHPGRGFAARAEQWSGFRDAWAARPAG